MLADSRVGVVGLGAIGTVMSDQLVRAGVGSLRIVDRDFVELSNLQRQTLFDEEDVRLNLPKAVAAKRRLNRINSAVAIEESVSDLNSSNVEEWVRDLDLVLDGLDNFETRFVLNDACRQARVPWVFGAAVGSYGLVLPVVDHGPCLRCALPSLPPAGSSPTCDSEGVINPITAIIASLEIGHALRILTGQFVPSDVRLTTVDVWTLKFQSIRPSPDSSCVLCVGGRTEYLAREPLRTVVLCGRNAVQLIPDPSWEVDLMRLRGRMEVYGRVEANEFLVRCSDPPYELTLFRDGRAIVKGTEEPSVARSVYSRMVGA